MNRKKGEREMIDFLLETLKYFFIIVAALFCVVCIFAAVIGFLELLKGHFAWYLIPATLFISGFFAWVEND